MIWERIYKAISKYYKMNEGGWKVFFEEFLFNEVRKLNKLRSFKEIIRDR